MCLVVKVKSNAIKNTFESVLMEWMNLEPVTESEISQKEKQILYINAMVLMNLFAGQQWRRKRQPTPVFSPGESQGRGSLMGCRLWGHTESDTTEAT